MVSLTKVPLPQNVSFPSSFKLVLYPVFNNYNLNFTFFFFYRKIQGSKGTPKKGTAEKITLSFLFFFKREKDKTCNNYKKVFFDVKLYIFFNM